MADVVLITGCSSGIGKATALLLANRGYIVYATARKQEDLKKLVEDGKKIGVQIYGAPLDVTNAVGSQKLVNAIVKKEGKIDILINNAGYGQFGPLEEITEKQMRDQMEVNFFGAVRLMQFAIPHMREQKHGTIINVSSVAGRVAFALSSPYNASKFAIEGVSESLLGELAGFGINVVLIEPGFINTSFRENADAKIVGGTEENKSSPYHSLIIAQRNRWRKVEDKAGTPEDVAQTIYSALTAETPNLRYPVTAMAKQVLFMKKIMPEKMFESMMRKR